MIGPGKYDKEAMAAFQAAKARGVVLIVIGGERGSGFSVVATAEAVSEITTSLPKMLKLMADDIEKDLEAMARKLWEEDKK